jgi:hypothetical protein
MWQRGNRGRGQGRNQGQWPGNGPFSHLPPWQRPGWLYGRGSCWYLYSQQQNQGAAPEEVPTFPNQFASGINFCTQCSAPLPTNANYCPSCGKKVG